MKKFDETVKNIINEASSLRDSYYKVSDGIVGLQEYYKGEAEVPAAVKTFIKAFEKMDKEMKFGKTL
jgi:hypothetical protein